MRLVHSACRRSGNILRREGSRGRVLGRAGTHVARTVQLRTLHRRIPGNARQRRQLAVGGRARRCNQPKETSLQRATGLESLTTSLEGCSSGQLSYARSFGAHSIIGLRFQGRCCAGEGRESPSRASGPPLGESHSHRAGGAIAAPSNRLRPCHQNRCSLNFPNSASVCARQASAVLTRATSMGFRSSVMTHPRSRESFRRRAHRS